MSVNLTEVRAALAETLAEIDGTITVYKDVPHTPVHLPCLIIYPPDTINYMAARDTDIVTLTVTLIVGPQDPTAVDTLEAIVSGTGALSVKAALYANRTLNGTVSNLRLLDMTSGTYSIATNPNDNAIGADFRVEITA